MKKNSQRGEVVIEVSIVVTVVVLFLAVIFYVGMLLYQQTALTTVANKTASNIAMLYSNNQKDPFTGYINSDGVYQNITYSDLKNETYMQELEKKANAFAAYSLKSSDMLNTGKPEVKIEIVDKKGEVLKNQVVVTITNEFKAPLVGIFSDDTTMKCTAVGRADCVDILDYINGVDAISNPEDSNVLTFPEMDSCVVTFIDNPDTNNVVAVVPVLKGHSISSAESIKEAHSFWPDNPKIKGIKFTNWVDGNGRAFTRTTQVNSSITVYGAWQCTVKFYTNDGTNTNIVRYVTYGKTLTFPTVNRAGYRFIGWYDNNKCTGKQYYSNTSVFKGSCNLYAKWQCLHKDASGNTKMEFVEKVQKLCREVNGAAVSYERFKCRDCGYESKNTIQNKHYIHPDYLVNTHEYLGIDEDMDDFTAQCNINHLSQSISGISGSYDSGFGSATISSIYHITCYYCGMHSPKVWWDNVGPNGKGPHVYKHIYFTADSSSRKHTECQEPDYDGRNG